MLKKISWVLIWLCLLTGVCFAEKTKNEIHMDSTKEIAYLDRIYVTDGESSYKDYKKLNGYPLQNKFQIYFQDSSHGNVTSYHVTYDDLRGIDFNEVWDFTLPNGAPFRITRGQVNRIFADYEHTDVGRYLKSIFPGAYEDWFQSMVFSQDANRLVDRYLENNRKKNLKSTPKKSDEIEIVVEEQPKVEQDHDGVVSHNNNKRILGGILGF